MSLESGIIDCFENLPHLALSKICKNLKPIDKVILSVVSDKFNQSISPFKPAIFHLHVKIIGLEANVCVRETRYDKKWYIKLVFGAERQCYKLSQMTLIAYKSGSKSIKMRQFLENCLSLKDKIIGQIYLEIDDSKWMEREDLLKFRYREAKLENCKLTEEDVNVFLKHWMEVGLKHTSASHLQFQVGKDFQMDKVLEGVEPKKWDPKSRDQKYIVHGENDEILEPTDLSEGHDIKSKEHMATVHLIDDILHFFVWINPFGIAECIKILEIQYTVCDQQLSSGELFFEDATWHRRERERCWLGLKLLANRQYEWGTGSGKYEVLPHKP